MKTLVIHPSDPTTDFLSPIYDNNSDWTVVRGGVSNSQLRRLIRDHDRIIMLGHGTPSGLIGHQGFIINSSYVDDLREKDTVCIWCNADQFVEKYGLTGFYTGMIISEVYEAIVCDVDKFTEKDVNNSNFWFALAIAQFINEDKITMHKEVLKLYNSNVNPIIMYNQLNIYQR